MNFCPACGNAVRAEIPAGDSLFRYVCTHCALVHYENPKIVAGCVPEHGNQLLLCKRAIEPRYGFWTVPAGFMELGETLAEAACRETREEACADVELGAMYTVVDVTHARQVHVFFRATLPVPRFAAGDETLETRLVPLDEIPWDELAFPSVRIALEQLLAIRGTADGPVHLASAPRLGQP